MVRDVVSQVARQLLVVGLWTELVLASAQAQLLALAALTGRLIDPASGLLTVPSRLALVGHALSFGVVCIALPAMQIGIVAVPCWGRQRGRLLVYTVAQPCALWLAVVSFGGSFSSTAAESVPSMAAEYGRPIGAALLLVLVCWLALRWEGQVPNAAIEPMSAGVGR